MEAAGGDVRCARVHPAENLLRRLWSFSRIQAKTPLDNRLSQITEKKFPEHHWNDGAETTCLRNGKPIFQFNPSSLSISNRGPTLKEMHVFL